MESIKSNIKSLVLAIILLFVFSACTTTVTPVYLLRHAEKASTPVGDPDLTTAGHNRAQELKRILNHVSIAAVYTTSARRTRQTITPLCADKNLTPFEYNNASVAATVLNKHATKPVVIVGHSNTIAGLISAFGGNPSFQMIPGNQYDNLFLLIVKKEKKMNSKTVKADILHMKYGKISN